MLVKNLSRRQIMNRIYKDICGFEITRADEQRVRTSKGSPTYGEINHEALSKLFEYLDLKNKDVFYDLGSGVGKVVLHAALFTKVKKAVGVELSLGRFKNALRALDNARDFDDAIHKRCTFINADLLTIDLSAATVLYTCSTAFSLAFMRKVTKHLKNFSHDFRLVSLQDLPTEKDFDLVDKLRLDMSWARKTPVYIYRRRQD